MHYSKESITAFLDGVVPFASDKFAELRKHPVIYNMACDIETLYALSEADGKTIAKLSNSLMRYRVGTALTAVAVAGCAISEYERRKRKREQLKEDNRTVRGTTVH